MNNPSSPLRRLPHGLVLLYEDRDILALDKPAGLLSIAAGAERDKTAYWILAEYLRKRGEKRRPAVVHRLDRDTSGVMIFAKSGEIKRRLMDNWDELVKVRRYTALVEGQMAESEGLIDAPLGEDKKSGRMMVKPGGMRALTRWRLIKQGRVHALLGLELETGRRNQIRVHLASTGHPVAGDRNYGARTDPLRRLGLHAEELSFLHPRDGRLMEFRSPAPPGFQAALRGNSGQGR
jgi:23S rRNA pseudouridine1911/1915/1917 synthase